MDPDVLAELDPRHPRVRNLWRAGQDYLMCGQVLAAASGIITALRMRGPVDTIRFGLRAVRLLWESNDDGEEMVKEKKGV